jgi:hypothetical protein
MDGSSRSYRRSARRTLKKLVLSRGLLQDETRTVESLHPSLPFNFIDTRQNQSDNDLQRLPCDKASKMLGIYMAPSGNRNKMVEELRKKAVDWASRIRLGRASPQVAWTALHTTISAKLKYALPACTFNEAECNKIMAPAIMAGLP